MLQKIIIIFLVPENSGTPEKFRIMKRGPGNPVNPEILVMIPKKFQNNKQLRNVPHNEFVIININKEGKKLIF